MFGKKKAAAAAADWERRGRAAADERMAEQDRAEANARAEKWGRLARLSAAKGYDASKQIAIDARAQALQDARDAEIRALNAKRRR
ncbi:hypothetical protein [Streptomyces sp. NPDC005955]|uniref:hypothetical protein n=1 Tax=Streptomyces sp. NPDC005955 TaxID=3364738 RepID=UPI0036AB7D43